MALSMANRSVSTLRPVSAAKVRAGRTPAPHAVITACTGVVLLHQQARQLGRFVSRDAAADAENDPHEITARAAC